MNDQRRSACRGGHQANMRELELETPAPGPRGAPSTQRFAMNLEPEPANRSNVTPKTPGATKSPQRPGQTPDRSTIPGHHSVQAPPPPGPPIRPAVEYLTAQELSHAMPLPDEPAAPA